MTEYTTPEGTPTAGSASSIITTSIGASEETVSAHLDEHADMFADPITDDTIQEITYGELKELLQTVFEQGILRGIPTGQDTALELINNDPEIDTETKEYITNLVKGGNN
jgi:hypothetical protein